MRLIDADALLESERATGFAIDGRGRGKSLLTLCRNYLHVHVTNAPTIDAVPVVRCKDCANRYREMGTGPWCCDEMDGHAVPDDFFCAAGERRSDD